VNPLAGFEARPRLSAVLGAIAIAFSGVFYRWSAVSPITGVFWRSVYGLPVLLLVAASERRRLGPMTRRAVVLSAVAGVFFTIDLTAYHYAVDAIGAGLATVLANLQVVIVAVVAWLAFGERPRTEVVVAIPVMLIGVGLISGVVGAGAYGADPRAGVLLGLVAAAGYSGYLLVMRRASPDRRPAGPVAISTAVTGLLALVLGVAIGNLDLVPSLPSHAYLLALGLLSQSLGYLAIQASLTRLPAVVASVLLFVQPVTTMLLGTVLLGELPSPTQVAGVVLVIAGMAVATGSIRRLRSASMASRDAGPAGDTATDEP
jgi:drug/metabolite transporter (DMT)-like permease